MSKYPFVKGQRVWFIEIGWGTVTKVSGREIDLIYPVTVKFDNEAEERFTIDGKLYSSDYLPMLYHDEIPDDAWPDPPPPQPNIKQGQTIWVRDDLSYPWRPRVFAEWDKHTRRPLCYINGCGQSDTKVTEPWRYYRLTDPALEPDYSESDL